MLLIQQSTMQRYLPANLQLNFLAKEKRYITLIYLVYNLLTQFEIKCSSQQLNLSASSLICIALQMLRKAMKGLGTDDSTLIRILATRAEIDLQKIKEDYLKRYKRPLVEVVHSDTSGYYRAFLLSLLSSKFQLQISSVELCYLLCGFLVV